MPIRSAIVRGVLAVLLGGSVSLAEAQPEPEAVPWPARIGLRIANLRARVPTVDRVVLVPDEDAFVDAIGQWSLGGRWPILIEDDFYAPLFIRRFRPAEIVRWAGPPTDSGSAGEWEAEVEAAIAAAWTAPGHSNDDGATPAERWKAVEWTPPGVVIVAGDDPARVAAAALAADRGQPVVVLNRSYGEPDATLNARVWDRLRSEVQEAASATGYAWAALGDEIDTITLVGAVASKYRPTNNANETLAVTDGLGRTAAGERWAIAGWIFGSPERAAYQAMCSIFLQPESALFVNGYPEDDGAWAMYRMTDAATIFESLDFEVEHAAGAEGCVDPWRRRSVDEDLVAVNTKGMRDWFDLRDGRLYALDVPALDAPALVHFTHSWSAAAPANRGTIAARWLEQGAYAYVGSVHEPYLQAFVPPLELARRWRASVPFLVAARQFDGEPWKITTIGDPLMTLLKPLPRVEPKARPLEGADDLGALIAAATRSAQETGAWAETARLLRLAGRDELLVQLYRKLDADDGAAWTDRLETTRAMFDALRRAGTEEELIDAALMIGPAALDPKRVDALWHRIGPWLETARDGSRIPGLVAFIREPMFVDASRLAPALARTVGADTANALLDRAEATARDGVARRMIREARP
ncbi:MAG: hypothetical protein ACF8PN_06090 [Phycisphaerales bacterium]